MLEAPLRDLLSTQIAVLEDGLQLLEIEKYLPSTVGTRSFIDILAKDQRGRWVLIELKRSDAAAREAIHEIHKYLEAVKSHLGARDDEIRAIVVSTEWKELLVPFSRFTNDTPISVFGVHLIVDEANGLLAAERVETLPFNSGRVLSPWHEISMYLSHERLLEGIASYDVSCYRTLWTRDTFSRELLPSAWPPLYRESPTAWPIELVERAAISISMPLASLRSGGRTCIAICGWGVHTACTRRVEI